MIKLPSHGQLAMMTVVVTHTVLHVWDTPHHLTNVCMLLECRKLHDLYNVVSEPVRNCIIVFCTLYFPTSTSSRLDPSIYFSLDLGMCVIENQIVFNRLITFCFTTFFTSLILHTVLNN